MLSIYSAIHNPSIIQRWSVLFYKGVGKLCLCFEDILELKFDLVSWLSGLTAVPGHGLYGLLRNEIHSSVKSLIIIHYTPFIDFSNILLTFLCLCIKLKVLAPQNGNRQSGLDWAVDFYSQSTRCFWSMEGWNVIWLGVELRYQQPFIGIEDCTFKVMLD